MDDVVERRAYIDGLLSHLLAEISELPEVRDTFQSRDRVEFSIYLNEVPYVVDQVGVLGRAVEAFGTEEQRAQYAELLRLLEEHRPIIKYLLSL